MKIISLAPPWTRQATCKGCKTRVEIEAGDVRYGDFGVGGDHVYLFFAQCPKCPFVIVVSNPPDVVADAARARPSD